MDRYYQIAATSHTHPPGKSSVGCRRNRWCKSKCKQNRPGYVSQCATISGNSKAYEDVHDGCYAVVIHEVPVAKCRVAQRIQRGIVCCFHTGLVEAQRRRSVANAYECHSKQTLGHVCNNTRKHEGSTRSSQQAKAASAHLFTVQVMAHGKHFVYVLTVEQLP